jgi:hypothetical protein
MCSQYLLKELATFHIKLPDFGSCHSITIQAYVEDASIGCHDIVLGLCFIQQPKKRKRRKLCNKKDGKGYHFQQLRVLQLQIYDFKV